MRHIALAFACLVACHHAETPPREDDRERAAARVLLAHVAKEFREHYAPRGFKEARGWSLERQIHAVNEVIEEPRATKADLAQAFRRFFHSVNDLHTTIVTAEQRDVFLGFHALVTEQGLRVAWVDGKVPLPAER